MKIRIYHPHLRYAPKWSTLQTLVSETLDIDGEFIRIARSDGGCDYRAPGEYCVWHRWQDTVREIRLDVDTQPSVDGEALYVLEALAQRFPGLIDGETAVNGAELVQELSGHLRTNQRLHLWMALEPLEVTS